MKIIPAQKKHIPEIMKWFPDKQSCTNWGGPMFRFPFTEKTFFQDLNPQQTSSYLICDNISNILAFGQFSIREKRCHLSRLAVSPLYRKQGFGKKLIEFLSQTGGKALNTKECSLFVLKPNTNALNVYLHLGFVETQYPGEKPCIENCLYMVKKI